MHTDSTQEHQQHLDYVDRNFDALRACAIEDLTHYTSRWAVYTVDFLNCVAEIQGCPERVDGDIVSRIRNDRKRILEPRVEKLISEAKSARSMRIDEVIGLISAECSRIAPEEDETYKELF